MTKPITSAPHRLRIFYILVLLLPLLLYGGIIGFLHRNLPAYDDYIVQLEIAQILNAGSILDQFKILFSQLNEHRIAYTRFWFLASYLTGHNLSYSALIFMGNLPLIGIWLLILWWLRETAASYMAMLCIGWMLFQFQFFENSLWAMAGLQNITIHLCYLLLFTLLAIPSAKAWRLAIIVAIIACFTSGNGFLVLAIGMLSLAYQRRWLHLSLWAVLTGALFCFYFYGYESVSDYSMMQGAPASMLDKMLGVFAFLGQACAVHPLVSNGNFILAAGFITSFLAVALSMIAAVRLWRAFAVNRTLGKTITF